MKYFRLELEKEKSHLIEFGRFAEERCKHHGKKSETFDFAEFKQYCSKSWNGKFRVKKKTSKKKFAKKYKEVHRRIGGMRNMEFAEIIKKLNQMLVGYYHYYGITENSRRLSDSRYEVIKSLFFW